MPKAFEILEAEANKPFKIKGIAMIKNSLSKNGRHYSDKLVEGIVEKISSIIEQRGSYPVNMMADHPGIAANKTLTTVGKITKMYLEGDNAIIEAEIANTSIGKDVQELIRGQFVEGLSIRATRAKMQKMYIGEKLVNDVKEMELQGVDLVTNPGVEGARVLDIIESDESNNGVFISIDEEEEVKNPEIKEEKQLDYSKIVLEELKNKRPDLIENLKKEYKPVFEEEFKVNEINESVNNLTTEKQTLQESFDTLKGEKETLEGELNTTKSSLEEAQNKLNEIEEQAKAAERSAKVSELIGTLKFADSVKESIKKKIEVLESVEEIQTAFESEKSYVESIIAESTGFTPSGNGHTGENHSNSQIDEDEDFINQVLEA